MHDLLIVMVVVWTVGRMFRPLGLPLAFGELVGGIIVGPAVLNLVNPDADVIRVLSELGVFFLMLHTGLKTDHRELFGAGKQAMIVAVGGAALPFAGGYAIARMFGLNISPALFIGMGLSVSAIAVAARVLKDEGIEHTRAAHVTMGAAIVQDIAALIAFSMILSFAESGTFSWMVMVWLLLKTLLFFGGILWLGLQIGPYLHRFLGRGNKGFTLTLIVALTLGLAAEAIGLHAIIGAFLAGLFMQEKMLDAETFRKIEDRMYGMAYSFFGPVFFASLAFHIDFSALATAPMFTGAILFTAFAGKMVGTGGAALLGGMRRGEALITSISMNSRGAVELIIAAIGLERGIIDSTVFSVLVLMAFVTTAASILLTRPIVARFPLREGSVI